MGRAPVGNGQALAGFSADLMPGVAAVEVNLLGAGSTSLPTLFATALLGAAFLALFSEAGVLSVFFRVAAGLTAATGFMPLATGLTPSFFEASELTSLTAAALGLAFFATTASVDFDTACLTAGFFAAGFFALVAI